MRASLDDPHWSGQTRRMLRDPQKRRLALNYFYALLAVTAGQTILFYAGAPRLGKYYSALVFLACTIVLILREKRSFQSFGIGFGPVAENLRSIFFIGLPVLALFTVGYLLLGDFLHPKGFHWHGITGLGVQIPLQLCTAGIPEELFFRGYLQGSLEIANPAQRRLISFAAGETIILPAILFAAAHFLTDPRPVRLATFFPGLLFGYLRFRTGSVAAPVTIHTLANLIIFVLEGKV
jgi:membrane protease YdiL (CAAX protease family)